MYLLKNATVFSVARPPFVGDVLIEGKTIREVGEAILCPGAQTLDATGLYAMPGIVDAHDHIGMWEDGIQVEGDDGNEMSDPCTPELRAIDAINPFDRCFKEAREGGITTCVTGPGSANVLGGQFAALKTWGSGVDAMLIKAPIAMKAALGENPKSVYSGQKAAPQTRMATAAILRRALLEAQAYALKLQAEEESDKPEFDMVKEAMLPVLSRELPLKIHAHRADDILTALRIAKEFNLRITLDHCTEGHLIPEHIKAAAEAGAGIILGPLLTDRSKVELRNQTFAAPRLLHEAGVEFALMSDHPVIPVQYLPVVAALAVRDGLPEEIALKAITLHAARAVGLSARIGSLEPGKDADIAVFSAHPFSYLAKCVLTLIDGTIVHDAR
ncbi:MAG: amidohydrolase [Christensenellaceae bacterium]|jgi:imidazolonepropionase-like amidohydrolase|nr:amidohydrolase [Christensenellaceae bacterium]